MTVKQAIPLRGPLYVLEILQTIFHWDFKKASFQTMLILLHQTKNKKSQIISEWYEKL